MEVPTTERPRRARPGVIIGAIAAGFVALALTIGLIAVSFGYVNSYDIPFWPHAGQDIAPPGPAPVVPVLDCEAIAAMTPEQAAAWFVGRGYVVRYEVDRRNAAGLSGPADTPPKGSVLKHVSAFQLGDGRQAMLVLLPSDSTDLEGGVAVQFTPGLCR